MKAASWLLVLAFGCSDGASARLALDNQTAQVAARQGVLADGTSLRLKLIAVYLAEDVDPATQNNVGATSMIWLNPQCADDIGGCNVEGLVNPPGPRVTDFFDLARPTAEVNAELNAQAMTIGTGTYRYARVELCKIMPGETQPSAPTLRWAGPGMTEQPFTSTDCGRTSLPFDPPLELVEGDSVTVELGYDLAASIVTGTPASGSTHCSSHAIEGDHRCFRACAETAPGVRTCMDFPDFAPAATVQP